MQERRHGQLRQPPEIVHNSLKTINNEEIHATFFTESEYTFRLGKDYVPLMVQKYYKPDGWLGALLGTKLYIDFSGKYAFEPKWNELIKELHAHSILGNNHIQAETSTGKAVIHPQSNHRVKYDHLQENVEQKTRGEKNEECGQSLYAKIQYK